MKSNYRNNSSTPYSGAPAAYRRPGSSPRGNYSRPPWARESRGRYRGKKPSPPRPLPGINLMIALVEYPKSLISEEQLAILEGQILDAIDNIEDGTFKPQFLECKRETGSLILRCNNDLTVNWLKETLPTLTLWEGAELKIVEAVPNTSKDISKVIVPKNYPVEFFNTEQLNKLQSDILKEIDTIPDGSFMPQFLSCVKERGALKFNCNNLASAEWLRTTVPTLDNWKDEDISIFDPETLPVRNTLQLWIPGVVEEPEQVLERLERQNKGLDTLNWQVLSKKVEEGGQKLIVTVQDAVLEALKKIDYNPFLNFARVRVKRLGRYNPRQKKEETKDGDPVSEDISEFTAIDEVNDGDEEKSATVAN